MNSLPVPDEQHEAFDKLIKLRYWRLNSDESEEYIATHRLGFESAEHMYQQLKRWEWPDWTVYPPSLKREDERQRKARRGTGERVELPPAKEAIPLFEEVLDVLREAIDDLEHRKEYFQDGRFVVETYFQGHAYDGGERVEVKGAFPGGAQQSPPEPLTTLIAVYILAGLPPEPLLSTLNREPGDVDLDQLDLNIEGRSTSKGHTPGLKSKARHVARLIRAGKLRPGRDTGEFSADQHSAAWRLYRLEQQGLARKDIEQKLRKHGFNRQDIAQLRKLGLLPPTL
jgi:hypothetical protein